MNREDVSRIIDLLYDANLIIRSDMETNNNWGIPFEEIKRRQIDYIIEHF